MAAGAVGLERLGGVVVVPAAALGEIAEGEPAARGRVTAALRVPLARGRSGWAKGSQPLKSPTTEVLPGIASRGRTKLTLTALRPLTGACLITPGSFRRALTDSQILGRSPSGFNRQRSGAVPMTGVGGGPGISRSLHGTTVGSGRVSGSPCLRPALLKHIGPLRHRKGLFRGERRLNSVRRAMMSPTDPAPRRRSYPGTVGWGTCGFAPSSWTRPSARYSLSCRGFRTGRRGRPSRSRVNQLLGAGHARRHP